MSRPRTVPALCAALTCAVAGCGGSALRASTTTSETTSSPATRASNSRAPTPRRHPRARSRGAPVGTAQPAHAGTSTLSVTVTRVIDPLAGTGSAVLPGHRAAGVQVAIRDASGATYDSTASGDWSLLTTAGPASPLFVRHGVCQTPLTDFESLVGVGETRDGCVAFSVPRGARILSVRFSPHARAPGSVTWR